MTMMMMMLTIIYHNGIKNNQTKTRAKKEIGPT